MRKLLANNALHLSDRANCTVLNPISEQSSYSNISTVTSRRAKQEKTNIIAVEADFTPDVIEDVLTELNEIQNMSPSSQLIDLSDITTSYIAANIEISIEKKYSCDLCKGVFAQNERVHQAFTSSNHTRKACQSTFEICRAADYFLRLELLKGQYSLKLIQCSILSSLDIAQLYTASNFSDHDHSKRELVDYILIQYIRYKVNYIAKTVSFEQFQENVRRKLSRLIINNNM